VDFQRYTHWSLFLATNLTDGAINARAKHCGLEPTVSDHPVSEVGNDGCYNDEK
jgi:hypothetical protein